MTKANPPSIIKALKEKAQTVRDIAQSMGIAYTETVITDNPHVVRFVFDGDFTQLQPLLTALPEDIFAYRGIIGSGWPGKDPP